MERDEIAAGCGPEASSNVSSEPINVQIAAAGSITYHHYRKTAFIWRMSVETYLDAQACQKPKGDIDASAADKR